MSTDRCDACVMQLYSECVAQIAIAKLENNGHNPKYTSVFAKLLRKELIARGLDVE